MKFPVIDKNSYIPAYIQIKDHFLKLIETHELKPGDQIPPENDIVQISGLSRMTVRQGIQQLVQQGYLKAQRGLGTFVTTPAVTVDTMSFCSFKQLGFQGQEIHTKVYTLEIKSVSAHIAKLLDITNKEPIWYCERTRFIGEKPIIFEIAYLPKHLFPNLTKKDLENSKYSWIQQTLSNNISFTKKEYSAIMLNKRLSEIFTDLTTKTPIIQMNMLSFLDNHTPFEYSIIHYHPENYPLSTVQIFKD